jgi:hypothetical protein
VDGVRQVFDQVSHNNQIEFMAEVEFVQFSTTEERDEGHFEVEPEN